MRPRINRRGIDGLVEEIFAEVGDKESLSADVERYVGMDVGSLPNFNEDGSVALYECGGILLGKSALVRFMERIK